MFTICKQIAFGAYSTSYLVARYKNKIKQSKLPFDANFSSLSLAESPPSDLQITAYKYWSALACISGAVWAKRGEGSILCEAQKECEAQAEGRRKIKLYFSLSVQIKFLLKSMKHETNIAEELYVCVLFLLDQYTRFQLHIAYSKSFTLESGFKKLRIRLPDSPDTCGRKPNPAAKKKLRIQKYPDTCGQGVIKLKLCCKRKNLHLNLIPVHKQLWEIWKLGKPLSFIPDFRDIHP